MYKRAGITICVLILLIEVVIFLVVKGCSADKPSETSGTASTPSSTPVVSTTVPTITTSFSENSVPVTTAGATTVPAPASEVEHTTKPAETSAPAAANQDSLVLIKPDTIPQGTDVQDVGTIVGKKVYVRGSSLITSLLVNTTTCGQIEYFGTLNDYNVAEGTRVKCQIRVFKADNGSEYKAVISLALDKS